MWQCSRRRDDEPTARLRQVNYPSLKEGACPWRYDTVTPRRDVRLVENSPACCHKDSSRDCAPLLRSNRADFTWTRVLAQNPLPASCQRAGPRKDQNCDLPMRETGGASFLKGSAFAHVYCSRTGGWGQGTIPLRRKRRSPLVPFSVVL